MIRFKPTYVLCSSPAVQAIYAEAFEVSPERVLTLGSPRDDVLLDDSRHAALKKEVQQKYALDPRRRTLIYAPTFRDSVDFSLPFNLHKLREIIGGQWQLLFRLHSSIKTRPVLDDELAEFVIDVSAAYDVQPLLLAADALISDYSSIVFDYALLNRPMIFYAYDLDNYLAMRELYFGYEGFVPGPIARTEDELYALLENIEGVKARYQQQIVSFARRFIAPADAGSCRRVAQFLGLEPQNL
jgi:CDP-glycerol glycerophosphotransferase (TagB/SpsB family)